MPPVTRAIFRPIFPVVPLVIFLVIIAWSSTLPAAGLPAPEDADSEARIDSLLRVSGVHLYDGRIDLAAAAVEAAAALAPRDPRIGLFRFRVVRESFPDDLYEEERARAAAPALLQPLDDAIARCDALLARDPRNPAGLLYRGWALMMKAQVHGIARQFGQAIDESGKAKRDLERVLARPGGERSGAGRPSAEQLDAGVILGGYLYFAATLPSIVKILQWLAIVPRGDAARGLELMRLGSEGDGYTSLDASLVLAVIDYLFEGRIDEARVVFDRLGAAHPWNPRLAELRASLALLFPAATGPSIDALERVIAAWGEQTVGWDASVRERLRWLHARLLQQAGRHDEALVALRLLVDEAPTQPAWIAPRALLALAYLEGNLGLTAEARQRCAALLADPRHSDYRDQARQLCQTLPSPDDAEIFKASGAVRRRLFPAMGGEGSGLPPAGDLPDEDLPAEVGDAPAAARAQLDRLHGDTPAARAHLRGVRGELEWQAGRLREAAAAFADVQASGKRGDGGGTAAWLAPPRLEAAIRLGEIHLALGDPAAAAAAYRQASDLEPPGTMLGKVIRGRLRYLEQRAK